jgi:hypothetical protein
MTDSTRGQADVQSKFYSTEPEKIDETTQLEYDDLRKAYLVRLDLDPELPSNGTRLRPKPNSRPARIDHASPEYRDLKARMGRLEKEQNHEEIFLLLRKLANHDMNPRRWPFYPSVLPRANDEDVREEYDTSEEADKVVLDVDSMSDAPRTSTATTAPHNVKKEASEEGDAVKALRTSSRLSGKRQRKAVLEKELLSQDHYRPVAGASAEVNDCGVLPSE